MLPEEIGSADDLDDLITTIGTQGIDLLDSPKFGHDKEFELEEGEDVELDQPLAHSRRPTIRFGCICARWVLCLYSREKAKSKLQNALNAASSAF